MRAVLLMTLLLVATRAVATPADEVSPLAVSLQVRETAGIRRYNYPVTARAELQQGAVAEVAALRLSLDGTPVPVQVTALSRWADRTLRSVELDFNAFVAPLSRLDYRLTAPLAGGRAPIPVPDAEQLTIDDTGVSWQIGKVRLGKRPETLIESAAFGRENVGVAPGAFVVTDADGTVYPLAGGIARLDKVGPLRVRAVYTGEVPLAGGEPVPFTITAEVPNSKSWVRVEARVDDPRLRVREISFATSVALQSLPATWDLGTGSWSYGVLREAADRVELVQTVRANGKADWLIRSVSRNQESIVERAAGARSPRAEGWGHIDDAQRVLAFAVPSFAAEAGTHRIALGGDGRVSFHAAPLRPADPATLAVYLHYVSNPTPIGAATPPVAMAAPLEVVQVE